MQKFLVPISLGGNQILGFRVENLGALPGAGSEGRMVLRTSDHTMHYDDGTAWVQLGGAGSVAWASLTGVPATFPPSAHNHTASQITDLGSAVNALITAYFDDATADTTRDTLVELIGLITSNESAIATLQSKADIFAANAPASTGTSATITHNLNTTDVIVQVREISTNQTVLCDVTVTNANVVTLGFASAQTNDTLRVVVMG